MRLHEVGHAVVPEVHLRHVAGVHRGVEALICVPTIDPAGCQTVAVGGTVIMDHASCRVQDLFLLDADRPELLQHLVEVPVRRLVGASILRRVDRVEIDAEIKSFGE